MNAPAQTTPPAQTAVVVAPKREIRVVEDRLNDLMDTAKFDHCWRIAQAMGKASLIPKHLKGSDIEQTVANCFLVVNQSLRWKLDPFAVAPETYEVGGKLGYQGKLIAAVINTRAGLADKLSYTFSGKRGTDEYEVTVSGRFADEEAPRTVSVSVGQAKTQNQMWTRDPEQKLVYTGSIRWARRHAPEIIMGIMTDDDLDFIKEEAELANMKRIKAPVFEGPQPQVTAPALPAPALTVVQDVQSQEQVEKAKKRNKRTLVEEPLDPKPAEQQVPPDQTQAASSSPVPSVTVPPPAAANPPANETPGEKELRELNVELSKLMAAAGITEEQLILYMHNEKWIKKEQHKTSEMSVAKLKGFVVGWQKNTDEMVKRIKGAK